jgi:hypothetical protein
MITLRENIRDRSIENLDDIHIVCYIRTKFVGQLSLSLKYAEV